MTTPVNDTVIAKLTGADNVIAKTATTAAKAAVL